MGVGTEDALPTCELEEVDRLKTLQHVLLPASVFGQLLQWHNDVRQLTTKEAALKTFKTTLFFVILVLFSGSINIATGSNALAAIPQIDRQVNPAAPKTAGAAPTVSGIASESDCVKVCTSIRNRLHANSKQVNAEYKLWQERLAVTADVIRFPQGFSAAEELLRFMSTYYVTKAPDNQMQPTFLAYEMGKCFPEAYIDVDRARLSGLVDTIWVAQNMKIAGALSNCK